MGLHQNRCTSPRFGVPLAAPRELRVLHRDLCLVAHESQRPRLGGKVDCVRQNVNPQASSNPSSVASPVTVAQTLVVSCIGTQCVAESVVAQAIASVFVGISGAAKRASNSTSGVVTSLCQPDDCCFGDAEIGEGCPTIVRTLDFIDGRSPPARSISPAVCELAGPDQVAIIAHRRLPAAAQSHRR